MDMYYEKLLSTYERQPYVSSQYQKYPKGVGACVFHINFFSAT